jgi:hypothetical protein
MGPGIANLVMAASTLQLPVAGTPSAIVTNLVTAGSSNIIAIGSVAGLNSFPTQVALIKYSGTIGGTGFNFSLRTLPSPGYTGYLSNNAANSSVDLVLSALLLAGHMTNGNFRLDIMGNAGGVVDILGSTNLADWVWLATVTNTTGTSAYTDPVTDPRRRYYRAHQIR